MWKWLRRHIAEKQKEFERQQHEARERRETKRAQWRGVRETEAAPKANRIAQEKARFESEAQTLMTLGLLEDELAEAIRDRRNTMLRRMKEILDE